MFENQIKFLYTFGRQQEINQKGLILKKLKLLFEARFSMVY